MEEKKNRTLEIIAKVLKYAALVFIGYWVLKFLVAGIAIHMLLAWLIGLVI